MKTLIVLSLFLFGGLSIAGCNPSSSTPPTEEDCGDAAVKLIKYTQDSILSKWPSNFIQDSLRVYNLWIPVDSICSKKHISSRHFVRMFPYSFERPFYFKAAVEWSIFFERTANGDQSFSQIGNETQVEWLAEVLDVGMAQSFGEGPANVFINIYVSFRTFGNVQQDSMYFVQRFRSAEQSLDYNFHKSSPADNQGLTAGKKERFALVPGKDEKTFYPGFLNKGELYRKEINNK
jgi:hypothetical protein